MRLLRPPFKGLVALIALTAVLLGALEHEDLIFQHADRGELPASSTPVDRFSSPPHDAGTEGVFRSDPHRFWLSPRDRPAFATRLHVATSPRWLPAAARPSPARCRIIGVMALRL